MSESETNPLEPQSSDLSPWSAPTADLEMSTTDKPVLPPRPWGPWATIGWTLLCIVVMIVVQLAGLIVFIACTSATADSLNVEALMSNGNVLAFTTLLSTPATVGLVALVIWLRGYPIRD